MNPSIKEINHINVNNNKKKTLCDKNFEIKISKFLLGLMLLLMYSNSKLIQKFNVSFNYNLFLI